jgi:hypothetical protein
VTGSRPPRSQVARKLISPFPHSTPYTPPSEIPTPWGFPELNIHLTKTTSRIWVTRSSTLITLAKLSKSAEARPGERGGAGNFFPLSHTEEGAGRPDLVPGKVSPDVSARLF